MKMSGMRFAVVAAVAISVAAVQPALAGDVRPIVRAASASRQAQTPTPTELASAGSDDSFTGGSGQMLKLADYRGKVVLLSFWASYCPPCKHELASLDRLQATLGGADFVVVPISVDGSDSAIASTYADYGVSHLSIYRELSDAFPLSMGVRAIPTNIMIGRDGRVVHFSMGATEWDSQETLEMVKSFIAAEPTPAPAAQQASLVTAAASGPDTDLGPSSH